jgi:hypothetical protein
MGRRSAKTMGRHSSIEAAVESSLEDRVGHDRFDEEKFF